MSHIVKNRENKMWIEIKSAEQAIDLLGGSAKVAALFERVRPRTVSNWRKRGIPAKAWVVLGPKLKRHGHFSYKLFDMLEPKRQGDRQNGR